MSSGGVCEDLGEADMPDSEALALFDQVTRQEMGISASEFLRKWDAGEWMDTDVDDVPGLPRVWILLATVRENRERYPAEHGRH